MSVLAALPDFVSITEVDDVRLGASVFRRKFGAEPPAEPHHVVSFYRAYDGALWPASYVHFRPWRSLLLVGGACTDGSVLRRMTPAEREAITLAGGIYLHALRWAFARYAEQCEAFFGYCGDARAMEIDLAAGFEATGHTHLIARWHRPLDSARRAELIAQAHTIGPF
jgi:hypothetical protein